MKILKKKYPKGTLPYQKTDGRYIDATLYENLKLLATKIVDDMTFLGIGFSSTLEVGTGKSVLFTQIGEAWCELMKDIHDIDVPFTLNNVVFRPEDLIDRAFQVPQYSCLLLDEWEDAHYWSKLGMTLRKFFRKCRQLNLFILVIIPNFFQMPINYAIGRSIFAIDVKFDDELERGNYDFYSFKAKKDLYIKGKKFHDYNAAYPDFPAEFIDGYGVPEAEYRNAKRLDMLKYDEEDKKQLTEGDFKAKILCDLQEKNGFTHQQMADLFRCSRQNISKLMKKPILEEKEEEEPPLIEQPQVSYTYNNILGKKKIFSSASDPPLQNGN